MIYAGVMLEARGLRRLWGDLSFVAVVRLGLAAVIGYGIGLALGLDGDVLATVVIMAAMPTAMMSLVIGAREGLRTDILAGAVVVTTLLATLTLPAWRAVLISPVRGRGRRVTHLPHATLRRRSKMKATGSRALFVLPVLLAAGAASLVLALGVLAGGEPALAGTDHSEHARAAVPARQVAFREDMRFLWEDHVTWTRMAIVDFAAGSPALAASQARLLRNQTDIGRAIAPFYGDAAGRRLTTLLREHILVAVDVLVAAKAGDARGLSAAQAHWVRNADQIAGFLSAANPDAWPRAEMRSMMRHHLKLTTDEAVARLTGDWRGDVRAYGKVHVQALHMADMLSAGIISQFPRRFR